MTGVLLGQAMLCGAIWDALMSIPCSGVFEKNNGNVFLLAFKASLVGLSPYTLVC
jgi:hypothetical protein